ncbi:MAG: DegT/DnrJ/EryC1/StrS family aminotransferase [Gemmatimonadota bacterium]
MIPRKRLDIGWGDLIWAVARCVRSRDGQAAARRVEAAWGVPDPCLAAVSVRGGFEALLTALDLPAGSEVAMSALTVRGMVEIVEGHGLVPVPVDVAAADLSVSAAALRAALSERTRAVLVAHLFGTRMPMAPVLAVARERGLLVIEDCAQAYTGDGFCGDPDSDVALFSFGPIKTATALGGALLRFRDPELRRRVLDCQEAWPVQGRVTFLARVGRFALLMALCGPRRYGVFVCLCHRCGGNHDRLVIRLARSYPPATFWTRIRRRPCGAQLDLLERRLRRYDRGRVARRVAAGAQVCAGLGSLERPGARVPFHAHWLFPVLCPDPDGLARQLWARGFDATRGGSSLVVVSPPPDRPEMRAAAATKLLEHVLYLPVYPEVGEAGLARLVRAVRELAGPRAAAP